MIAVAFALEFESAYFRAKHTPRMRLKIWLLGSMGSGVIAALQQKMEGHRPSLVISAGFAGGLRTDIPIGKLFIGRNYSSPELLAQLNLSEKWLQGDLVTVPAIIEKAQDKLRLGEETGALGADMETEHMAEVCRRWQVPMLSVRAISDGVTEDMPVPANVLLNPVTGRPEPLLLFRHLISNPTAVPGFNRLIKNAKAAQASLADGLDEILPQLLHLV